MWTHFCKWLGFVQFSVLSAHFPLVLKHIPPDQPWCANIWLGLKPCWAYSLSHCVLWKMTGAQMMWLTCSYSFVPDFLAYSFTSINQQGCCARCWRHVCFHPCLHACLRFPIFASDTASRAKIWFIQHAVKCWKHGLAIERRTSAWCNLMQGAICGNKIMAKFRRPVAWLHDRLGHELFGNIE